MAMYWLYSLGLLLLYVTVPVVRCHDHKRIYEIILNKNIPGLKFTNCSLTSCIEKCEKNESCACLYYQYEKSCSLINSEKCNTILNSTLPEAIDTTTILMICRQKCNRIGKKHCRCNRCDQPNKSIKYPNITFSSTNPDKCQQVCYWKFECCVHSYNKWCCKLLIMTQCQNSEVVFLSNGNNINLGEPIIWVSKKSIVATTPPITWIRCDFRNFGTTTLSSITDNYRITDTRGIKTEASGITTETSNITTDTGGITNETSGITTDTGGKSIETSGITTDTGGIINETSNITTDTGGITNETSNITQTNSIQQTSASSVTTPSSMCPCPCFKGTQQPPTKKELDIIKNNLKKELAVDKKNLSKTIRAKTSAPDERASAQGIGLIGVILLSALPIFIIIIDLPQIYADMKTCYRNLSSMFQKTTPG